MSIIPYEFKKKKNKMSYYFVTDKYKIYDIEFKFSDRFFDSNCSNCRDILEVDIKCDSEDKLKDYRIGATIFEIFSDVLSKSCNGVMYRCDDIDGRECKRELQFDRWFEEFNSDEKIDKFSQTFCDEDSICTTYYVLVDKGCFSYPEIVDNFMYRCKGCSMDTSNIC